MSLARKAIDWWALGGGLLLAAIVVINVANVVGGLFGKPFSGDFELTQMLVAAAAFMFLPYCQLNRQNVTADIFTTSLSKTAQRRLSALGSAVAEVFAALLLWRMFQGMLDQKAYNLASTILQIPIWWAYVPIILSLALLIVASAITLIEDLSGES